MILFHTYVTSISYKEGQGYSYDRKIYQCKVDADSEPWQAGPWDRSSQCKETQRAVLADEEMEIPFQAHLCRDNEPDLLSIKHHSWKGVGNNGTGHRSQLLDSPAVNWMCGSEQPLVAECPTSLGGGKLLNSEGSSNSKVTGALKVHR